MEETNKTRPTMTDRNRSVLSEFKVFKEYWQMISIAGSVMFFCIYLFVENREYRLQVETLTENNKEMKDRISRMEGQMEVLNQSLTLMIERNPGVMEYRLQKLEENLKSGEKSHTEHAYTQPINIYTPFTPSTYALSKPLTDTDRIKPSPISPTVAAGDLMQVKDNVFKRMFKKNVAKTDDTKN